MIDELPLVARRLPGEEQEQFLEVTRLKAEVELRYALAVPVVVTTGVLAAGIGLASTTWAIATGLSGIAGAAFLIDGWRRDRLRNDLLIELLALGKAKSPTFERLVERALATERQAFGVIDETETSTERVSSDRRSLDPAAGSERPGQDDSEGSQDPNVSR
jgi:hypothetical protein